MRSNALALGVIGVLSLMASVSAAGTFVVFGPEDFVRGRGAPIRETRAFTAPNPDVRATLRLHNGGRDRGFAAVSSAVILVNGLEVLGPSAFNRNVTLIEAPLTLQVQNGLAVELRGGGPGAGFTLQIVGIDDEPPTVAITSPADGARLTRPELTVTGTVGDVLSGIQRVTCNGVPAAVSGSAFTCGLVLVEGANDVTAEATDGAGNVGSAHIRVTVETTVAATVPDVAGLTHGAAAAALASAGLRVGAVTTAYSDGVSAGRVLDQTPPAAATVAAGSPVDLALSLGPAGMTPSISFVVDGGVTPGQGEVTPFADGVRRPVASLVDERGNQADFVQNELLLTTAEPAALAAFLARWQGVVLLTIDPAAAGLGLPPMHLVRVDPALADPAAIVADLRGVHGIGQGVHRVSSEAGLRLVAAAMMENAAGLAVGLNWVLEGHQFLDRATREAATWRVASGGMLSFGELQGLAWDPNTSRLYLVNTATNELVTIDSITGVSSLALAGFTGVTGLAFDANTGTLFGVGDSRLVTIDPASGFTNVVGPVGFDVRGLAFDPGANRLYGSDPVTDRLIAIDPATGAGTPVGPLGFGDVRGLDFDPGSGTLYGVDGDTDQLIRIDPATGAGVAVTPLGFDRVEGLAANPATGALVGVDTATDQLINITPTFVGGDGRVYETDAFTWPYMSRGSVQDIGVGEAWRVLELWARLTTPVTVLVADGGIIPNIDFPPMTSFGSVGVPNPGNCGGNPCAWHGTGAVTAGFGLADNRFGAAGPGGPVTRLLALGSPPADIASIIGFLVGALQSAAAQPAIISISAGTRIPAGVCALEAAGLHLCGALDALAGGLRHAGMLVFAAAGNEGKDVDEEDCVDLGFARICWEAGVHIPCELAGVVCVGGLGWDSNTKAGNSNFGSKPGDCCTVDIFGPYQVWTFEPPNNPATPVPAFVQLTAGTSVATPFVAGVAALIKAADPTLGPDQIEQILIGSAHTGSPDATVPRWVDALAAVCTALPNCPPTISITAPANGSAHPQGADIDLRARVTDFNGGPFSIVWISSVNGTIGTGGFLRVRARDLTLGPHTITAIVTDPGGLSDGASISLTVLPDADLDGLGDDDERARGTDPNDPDTDKDGLLDGREVDAGTNPLVPDSDGDGLLDGEEVDVRGTDPRNPDTDGDGVPDGVEVVLGTDPTDAASAPTDVPPGTLFAASSGLSGGAFLTLLDPPSGAVGLLGRPNGGVGFGLAFDETGRLFIGAGSRLAVHDPLGDVTTDLGPFRDPSGAPVGVTQLAYDPAGLQLYGVEDGPAPDFLPTGQLVRIDRATAEVERVGSPFAIPIHALAFTRDGRLYAALAGAPSDRLAELDPVTGLLVRDIGPIGVTPVFGLAFLRTGQLVAAHRQTDRASQLLAVDPATGAGTPLSTVARALFGLTVMPCPAPCLERGGFLGTSGRPVALGDLDGDGDLDLVTPLAAFLNDGTGRFALRQFLGDGARVALGDLDGDGRLDAVIAAVAAVPGGFDWTIRVHRGLGTGLFDPPLTFPLGIGATALNDLALADVTGDGVLDILVATAAAGGRIHILRGDGAGGFAPAPAVLPGGLPVSIALGDLDGDGAPDLVTALGTFAGTLTLHLGDGAGGFAAPVTVTAFPAGGTPAALALGDLDGDGRLDLAVTTVSRNTVAILLGDGAGGFAAPTEFPLDPNPAVRGNALALGDLTGDSRLDLATAHRNVSAGLSAVYVLVGDGAGGFTPALDSPFAVFDFASSVTLGDLDGDGLLDVVAPGEGITILLNHPAF